jgi:MalT-like TPR region
VLSGATARLPSSSETSTSAAHGSSPIKYRMPPQLSTPPTRLSTGEIHLSAGVIDEAASHARAVLDLSRRSGARGSEAHALCLMGHVAAIAGAEDAEGYYRQAMANAKPRGMRPLVTHCHVGRGKVHRRRGDREQAQQHITTAMAMYCEMGMTDWLEQAEAELRQLG